MDENPCAKVAQEGASVEALYAAVALAHMISGNWEAAEEWAKRIPRARRGDVFVALDDLSMILSRIGRG